MQRVTAAARGWDEYGTGKLQFQDRNTPAGIAGSIVQSVWLDAVQEELAYMAEYFGVALDPANNNQILPLLLGAMNTAAAAAVEAIPHGHADFLTAGVSSFTPPPGVYFVHGVMCGGAGGGGGSSAGAGAAGGGGAPGTIRFTQAVTPGVAIPLSVGAGGYGGGGGGANNGGNGAITTFGAAGSTQRTAAGGNGGFGSALNSTSNGGNGGSANVGLMGDTLYGGGNGLGSSLVSVSGGGIFFVSGPGATPSLDLGYGAPMGFIQGVQGFGPGGAGAGGAGGGGGGDGAQGCVKLWW